MCVCVCVWNNLVALDWATDLSKSTTKNNNILSQQNEVALKEDFELLFAIR